MDKKILERAQSNLAIFDSLVKADSVINNPKYKSIICSISGGADSDVMMDLIYKVDVDKKVKYVFIDTGLEYEATKKQIEYLEEKYNIEIIKERAIKPIPLAVKESGLPFVSKYVSEQIRRLQAVDFKWENKSFEELQAEYPSNVNSALKWWCNQYDGYNYNISMNKWLKEFLIKNPPQFKISSYCCKYAKKDTAKAVKEKYNADLMIVGVRKAEGGIRALAYESCFSEGKTAEYRPLFWYKDEDRAEYEKIFKIKHSDCYKKYKLKRTGCVSCPFGGKEIDTELKVVKKYEPKLYTACCNIFGQAHDYYRAYREFIDECDFKVKWGVKMYWKDYVITKDGIDWVVMQNDEIIYRGIDVKDCQEHIGLEVRGRKDNGKMWEL